MFYEYFDVLGELWDTSDHGALIALIALFALFCITSALKTIIINSYAIQ